MPRACATSVLNDMLRSKRLKPFSFQPNCLHTQDPDIAPHSPDGWTGHSPVLASQAEAAAAASRGRSGSCHHDIRHPWPLARRHASICCSAAARGKIRHMRPWPRIDQVALDINRRWQEQDTWFARVGVSIASRYSLWIRGMPLLGNGSRRRVPCCPRLESPRTRTTSMQTIQNNFKKS